MIAETLLGLGALGGVLWAATRDGKTATTPQNPTQQGGTPTTWTPNEATYFDINAQGLREWKEPYRSQILTYLQNFGVATAVQNDATVVQLVPKRSPTDASAAEWCSKFATTRSILACRWTMIQSTIRPQGPVIPEFVRAVLPEEELAWAGPQANAMYSVLMRPRGVQVQTPTPNASPVPNPPAAPDAFSELPEGLAGELRALMRDSTDPAKLILVADSLEGKYPGNRPYKTAADALRKRAKELQLEQETKAISEGKIYIVRGGEMQSEVAQWFTGDANKWRELGKTNPNMRLMRDTSGEVVIEFYSPWVTGQKVFLPDGWDIGKGMPPAKPRGVPRAA